MPFNGFSLRCKALKVKFLLTLENQCYVYVIFFFQNSSEKARTLQ
jgi:hypothetical protein